MIVTFLSIDPEDRCSGFVISPSARTEPRFVRFHGPLPRHEAAETLPQQRAAVAERRHCSGGLRITHSPGSTASSLTPGAYRRWASQSIG